VNPDVAPVPGGYTAPALAHQFGIRGTAQVWPASHRITHPLLLIGIHARFKFRDPAVLIGVADGNGLVEFNVLSRLNLTFV
jgi:hypothetical protein